MSKHTPGPWKATQQKRHAVFAIDAESYAGGKAGWIADVFGIDGENAANARLIAASPKMYDLLIYLNRRGGLGFDVHQRIEAVLAEIEGT